MFKQRSHHLPTEVSFTYQNMPTRQQYKDKIKQLISLQQRTPQKLSNIDQREHVWDHDFLYICSGLEFRENSNIMSSETTTLAIKKRRGPWLSIGISKAAPRGNVSVQITFGSASPSAFI